MLKISNNSIRELPEEFKELKSLTSLNLYYNKITSLPNISSQSLEEINFGSESNIKNSKRNIKFEIIEELEFDKLFIRTFF